MANIELLDQIIAHVEKNPETWNQKYWVTRNNPETEQPLSCGTAYCIAGHAVVATYPKAQFVFEEWDPSHGVYVIPSEDYVVDPTRSHNVYQGRAWIGHVGAEILGLNGDQADALFNDTNDLDEIKRIRDELAADPDWNPGEYWV